MSAPPTSEVTFSANLQAAPACYPPDVNGMLQLIAGGGLTGTIPSNAGGGVFVSSIPPSSSLTNKVWFKIDAAGRPLGIYMFYNGNWRKVYTGITYAEIRMFFGNPTLVFDSTGLGNVGGDADGWALCNGQNGTPDMTKNVFPVSGEWGSGVASGWGVWDPPSGSWQTQGGAGQLGHRIAPSDLPALKAQGWVVTQSTTLGGPGPFFTPSNPGQGSQSVTWPIEVGGVVLGGQNTALPLPNYIGFGFMMFVGYA
jgi:hypothetical protein